MAKYCKTYKILCVCPTCEGEQCARSPRTRAEAEISRSCRLAEDGRVLEPAGETAGRRDTPQESPFSPSRKVPLPPLRPARRFGSRRWVAVTLTLGLLVAGGMLHVAWRFAQGLQEERTPGAEEEEAALIAVVEEEPAEPAATAPPPAVETEPPVFGLRLEDLEPLPRRAPSRQTITSENPFESPRFVELKSTGNRLAREGNFAEARRYYREIIATVPSSPVGYNNLANTFSDAGDHVMAEPIYLQSLRHDPGSPTIHFNLGNNYLRAGRWADAEARFLHVLEHDPADWEALLLLGVSYYRQEKWRDATSAFLGVLSLNPDSAEACYNLHLAYRRVGATHLARSYLAEAYRLDPTLRNGG